MARALSTIIYSFLRDKFSHDRIVENANPFKDYVQGTESSGGGTGSGGSSIQAYNDQRQKLLDRYEGYNNNQRYHHYDLTVRYAEEPLEAPVSDHTSHNLSVLIATFL